MIKLATRKRRIIWFKLEYGLNEDDFIHNRKTLKISYILTYQIKVRHKLYRIPIGLDHIYKPLAQLIFKDFKSKLNIKHT